MIDIRHANERGRADFGWLQSRHSFSFGSYYDPQQMGFSSLRVINDDRVTPGAGFDTHGHRDMEILSYVLDGEIAHRDSEGNVETLPAGEFQLMSAGSGIMHSEFNPSATEGLHFLQIWILPNVQGRKPGYQQKDFGQHEGLTLVVSPDGAEGSLTIKQDARVYQLVLPASGSASLAATQSRRYYVHLIDGTLEVNGAQLNPGDGARIAQIDDLEFVSTDTPVRALVFDLS